MQRLTRFLATIVLLVAPFVTFAATFEEGRQYAEIPFPQPVETGKQIEVREFFWYGCPHCYTFEPVLTQWLGKKPKHVEFVRTPATGANWLVQARAYYAFEAMGALEKLHPAFFRAMHTANAPRYDDEASIAQFVASQGFDAARFREAYNSFGVHLRLERAKRLNEAYAVHSVPLLIVDGKYLTSPAMAGGEEAAIKAVEFLVQKAVQTRKH